MKIDILTIFPEIFEGFLKASLIGKAQAQGTIAIAISNIRDFSDPPHFNVDDSPYGGGAGMVMKPEPIARAITASKARHQQPSRVIALTPSGTPFNQNKARELSALSSLIFLCGRYEGIDQRVIDSHVDEEISIGDYVLMGGEVASMVIIESVTRLISSVIGNSESLANESFEPTDKGLLLEAPHYTRPPEFDGRTIPSVLLSGDHAKIKLWREQQSLLKTAARRKDLLT